MSSCDVHSDCPTSYYCSHGIGSKGVCKAKKYSGGICSYDYECVSSYHCSSITGTCKSYSSLSLGEKCNNDDAIKKNCAYGTYCHFPYSSATTGTCKYKKTLYESCQSYQLNQCNYDYYCSSYSNTCESSYSSTYYNNTFLVLSIAMPLVVFFIIVSVVVCICRRRGRARRQKLINANRASSINVISPYVQQPIQQYAQQPGQPMPYQQPVFNGYDSQLAPEARAPAEYVPNQAQNMHENSSAPMNQPPAYSGPTNAPPADVKRPLE